jgi:hypothetical protein
MIKQENRLVAFKQYLYCKKNDHRMKKWINYISDHSFLDQIFSNNSRSLISSCKLLPLESN